jgi:hypothetical protein
MRISLWTSIALLMLLCITSYFYETSVFRSYSDPSSDIPTSFCSLGVERGRIWFQRTFYFYPDIHSSAPTAKYELFIRRSHYNGVSTNWGISDRNGTITFFGFVFCSFDRAAPFGERTREVGIPIWVVVLVLIGVAIQLQLRSRKILQGFPLRPGE